MSALLNYSAVKWCSGKVLAHIPEVRGSKLSAALIHLLAKPSVIYNPATRNLGHTYENECRQCPFITLTSERSAKSPHIIELSHTPRCSVAEKDPQTIEGLWDLWCFCAVERSINSTQAAFLTCWVNLLYMVCAVCVCEWKCWAVFANKRRLPLSDMLKRGGGCLVKCLHS